MPHLLIAVNPAADSMLGYLLRTRNPAATCCSASRTPGRGSRSCTATRSASPNGPTTPTSSSACRCGPVSAAAGPSTSSWVGPVRTARRWCSPKPAAATWSSDVTALPQAGPTQCAHPDRPRPGHRTTTHRRRRPRALRLPVHRPAGEHRDAWIAVGDYGVELDAQLIASVERKSLADLVGSLINSRLRFQVADLAALPRAAVVVEDRYSQVFKLGRVRPAVIADGLA